MTFSTFFKCSLQRFPRPLFVFFISISLLLPSYTFAAKPYKKNLKIGVIGPMTGEQSALGKPIAEGAKLAAEDFNKAGGIDGKKIDVIVKDNAAGLDATKAALDEFILARVAAIIASPAGWSTFAPVNAANRSWTILMSVGTKRNIERSGNFIFRNTLSDEIATDAQIKYCSEKLGYKRYAIITSMVDDESALSAVGFYKKALQKHGGKIVSEAFANFDVALKESIADIKKDSGGKLDAVLFAGDAKNGADVLKEMRRQGIKAPLVGGEKLFTRKFLKRAGNRALGSVLYTSFTARFKGKETQAFVKKYRKKNKRYPTPLAAYGYDSFMLVAEAIKRSGTTEPKKVVDALWDTKNHPGVAGSVSMKETGATINVPFLLKVVKGKKGPRFTLVK